MTGRLQDSLITLTGFATALGVHAGALFLVLSIPKTPGAIPQQTTAISMNLSDALIIESVATSKPKVAKASDMDLLPDAGATRDAKQQFLATSNPEPQQRNQSVEPEEVVSDARNPKKKQPLPPTPQSSNDSSAPPDVAKKTTVRADPKPSVRKSKTRSKAAKKGARPTRSTAKAKPSTGQVSASRGQILNYAARVRARVASRRPKGTASRGTVIVSFGVSRAGTLRYARVSRSSGSSSLDRAAITSVRRASPFPRPPRGMTLRQLTYSIPFSFR